MAAMRLNIPAIFVSGGPMEAGKVILDGKETKVDLVDAMINAVNPEVSEEDSEKTERSACPTCGSCSGMFTANSMNCLAEALGMSLPRCGSIPAVYRERLQMAHRTGVRIGDMRLRRRALIQELDAAMARYLAEQGDAP